VIALKMLRGLGLDAWGELLWMMPDHKYPRLSKLLPLMSSESVQNAWTGTSGKILLNQTIPFVRYLLSVSKWRPKQNSSFKVLDYGCGYGRISRLLLKYVEVHELFGADPWQESIDLVHQAGFGSNFKLTDEVPSELPFELNSFDLIWAFSVFTHLSPQVAKQSLETLSRYLTDDGVLVITIRPIEYWDMRNDLPSKTLKELRISQLQTGTSFSPHNRSEVGTYGITYGDTTFSLQALEDMVPNLEIQDIERNEIDPYQIYISLKRR
jgi:SAM-dependent methyltransferase